MRYRLLGRTGIEVSEIGFGGWGIGGGWGRQDDAEALRALHRALELGVNFFDTALGYGNGHSEYLIGHAVAGRRDRVVIATKIPPKTQRWPVLPHELISETFPAAWIIECTEKSLRNLNTDYIDVQQLHAWTPAYTQQLEWYEALRRLQEQGKIRFFGISSNDWDPHGPVSAVHAGLVDTVQVIYNIFEQRPAEELFPACRRHNVGVIARVPFEEGLLSGQLAPGYQFEPGDWRARWLTPERLAEAARRVEALKEFLQPDHPTLSALALKFCLSHPAVSTVIPGMRRVEHVEANCAVSDGILLSPEELEALKAHAWVHGWGYPWSQQE
jgi:aryl-alcohol dehydrogenase-like predicted oxidoreductase